MGGNLPTSYRKRCTSFEHVFEDLIDSFNLATCLRMESRAETNVGAHGLLEGVPELGNEDASVI